MDVPPDSPIPEFVREWLWLPIDRVANMNGDERNSFLLSYYP